MLSGDIRTPARCYLNVSKQDLKKQRKMSIKKLDKKEWADIKREAQEDKEVKDYDEDMYKLWKKPNEGEE